MAAVLAVDGERTSGQDIRTQNVTACSAVSNIVKSSLGPTGLDKMLVDQIGDVTISNDGATILRKLDVQHPAAKVLVELSQHQDEEVGDGTTSVVILAAELLRRGNDLVKRKIHPTSVISGFRVAVREACNYIRDQLAVNIDTLGKDALMNVARTSMSSKILAAEMDFFADFVVRGALRVKTTNNNGGVSVPIKQINVLRAIGKGARDSIFVEGYALNCTIASQAMPRAVHKAKIAFLDFNVSKQKLPLGVSIELKDPTELAAVHAREAELLKERIAKVVASGANVVFTTKAIDDLAVKYFVEHGVVGVRRCKKDDLRRIAKACGGKLMLTLADLEGQESFDASNLGEAELVAQENVGDNELIVVRGCKEAKAASMILRGPNTYVLDEMDRSVHDSLCAVKRVLESGNVVPGGGAVEVALSMYLENFARTLGSREQLAIAEFASALLVIPKTLAVNAALDATDLTAKLCTLHRAAQENAEKKGYARYGLDLFEGKPRDNIAAGVLEPAMGKIKCIQFATEAAMSILRIDDLIKLNPKADPKGAHEHEDDYE
eukprot:TRINITY_DN11919_c2_g1_i1.p1 TRINITY_DN11919_c2_g1~~TRINITY_DN11919_c2_g1_i1.p1  ORF type:complete len:551 (-),score=186.51 TRINITY_DN11919_c2_g1_i1:123-1775(-)